MGHYTQQRMRSLLNVKELCCKDGDIMTWKSDGRTKWLDRRTEYSDNGGQSEHPQYTVFPLAMDDVRCFVVCPFCRDIHVHGKSEGWRTADCPPDTPNAYYYLKFERNLPQ